MTNIEIIKEWIKVLRSSKYRQGSSRLCKIEDNIQYHCCLGVLCEILNIKKTLSATEFNLFSFDGVIAFLPSKVVIELGFNKNSVIFTYRGDKCNLAQLNDTRYDFISLADCIEQDILPYLEEKETIFESLNIS